MNFKPLMTQAEYAAHRGVKAPAVSNWKAKDLLVFAEDPARPGKVLVNVQLTDARLATRIDPTRGRPSSGAMSGELQLHGSASGTTLAGEALAQERMEHLVEQKIGHRLKNAERARELVPLAEYERRSSELGRLARERMHSVVRSTAERLAAETDPRAIVALLRVEIDRAFEELADQVEAGALDAPADDDLPDPEAADLAEISAD